MIPGSEVAAFALATLGESINPGPTLAALVSARIRSRREAWGVVIGVALANIAWVVFVVLLKAFASQLSPWTQAAAFFKAFAALVLVFIATSIAARAVITVIESYILKTWSEPMATAPANDETSLVGGLMKGFIVHLINPLSFTYYLGAYSGTLASDASLALVFAFVAVVVDFLVYGAFASLPVERLLAPSPMTFIVQRVFALLAGFAMLFLVAHVFAIDRGDQLHGLRNLFMLLGFLAATIYTAEEFAGHYGGKKNKLLWRGLLVWQSAFGAFAIIGTILSVLARIDSSSVGIPSSWISEMAICSLVAAVATAGLSYARARGEMLDEAENTSSENLNRTLLLNSPKFVFPACLVGLILLFAFFAGSGFSG